MAANKKKSQSSLAKGKPADKAAPEQSASKPKIRWWKTTWARLVSILGIVAAILGAPPLINNFVEGAAKLPDTTAFVAASIRGDKHFVGEWTNDSGPAEGTGSVGPPLVGLELQPEPSEAFDAIGAVSVKLEVKNGLVTGEVTSKEIRDHFIYSHLFVSGVVSFGTLKLHVWDYVSGKAIPVAGLKANWKKVGDEERLEFTSSGELFPGHFSVGRGVGPKPSINVDFVKRLSNSAPKALPKSAPTQ